MRKYFLLLLLGTTLIFSACAKEGPKEADKQKVEKETPYAGLVNVIKKGKLVNYQSTTIGAAFDSYKYLTKKEWKVEQQKSGPFTVDFIGWFEPDTLNENDIKGGVKGRGLDVMFVVEPNGSYYMFMVSKLVEASDGKIYRTQLQDNAGILANIYRNEKIKL